VVEKVFAPEHTREEHGWIRFPSDVGLRKRLFFPEEVSKHPAKANIYLIQSCIEYVAEPGDVLLDPFGGTGTLMIAALQGFNVVLLELEDGYHKLQQDGLARLRNSDNESANKVMLLHGDNRRLLPIPCNHIITSPPYATAMKVSRVRIGREDAPDDWLVQMDKQMVEYGRSPQNFSKLNNFMFNQEIERLWRLCYQSLLPNGTLTILIKDRIVDGKRYSLSKWTEKVCTNIGLKLDGWFKWYAMGSGFTNIARSQGKLTVDDEDIIIFRK